MAIPPQDGEQARFSIETGVTSGNTRNWYQQGVNGQASGDQVLVPGIIFSRVRWTLSNQELTFNHAGTGSFVDHFAVEANAVNIFIEVTGTDTVWEFNSTTDTDRFGGGFWRLNTSDAFANSANNIVVGDQINFVFALVSGGSDVARAQVGNFYKQHLSGGRKYGFPGGRSTKFS